VERHERYRPVTGGSTFCNIYAYDYCFLAGAFIPRVWWTSSALTRLERGEEVPVSIGNTVVEVNANALSDWFEEHGRTFGWRRTFDLDDLQQAANAGAVGIIVARRAQSNRSGHITAVAPESGAIQAVRKDGAVSAPVQSEAGARNHARGTGTGRWWLRSESGGPKFSRFGFWVHE
jgi:hypothetical protein